MGEILGRLFRVTTWGNPMAKLGAVVDGCPQALNLMKMKSIKSYH